MLALIYTLKNKSIQTTLTLSLIMSLLYRHKYCATLTLSSKTKVPQGMIIVPPYFFHNLSAISIHRFYYMCLTLYELSVMRHEDCAILTLSLITLLFLY